MSVLVSRGPGSDGVEALLKYGQAKPVEDLCAEMKGKRQEVLSIVFQNGSFRADIVPHGKHIEDGPKIRDMLVKEFSKSESSEEELGQAAKSLEVFIKSMGNISEIRGCQVPSTQMIRAEVSPRIVEKPANFSSCESPLPNSNVSNLFESDRENTEVGPTQKERREIEARHREATSHFPVTADAAFSGITKTDVMFFANIRWVDAVLSEETMAPPKQH